MVPLLMPELMVDLVDEILLCLPPKDPDSSFAPPWYASAGVATSLAVGLSKIFELDKPFELDSLFA
jgi:hypothetical protein